MGRKPKDKSSDLLIATRLAGSTAAYLAANRVVRNITMNGRQDGGKGNIMLPSQRKGVKRSRWLTDLDIMTEFAGMIAVDCFSRQRKPEFDPTRIDRDLEDLAQSVTGSEAERDAYLHFLWESALCVFNKPGVWNFCGFLADELVEKRTLDDKRIKEIWNNVMAAAAK